MSGANRSAKLLAVERLGVSYALRGGWLRPRTSLVALKDVSFELREGETLGVVGESGSGKSTLARAIVQLVAPSTGGISWLGQPLAARSAEELRALKSQVQIVFQDPLASLDPRMTVLDIVAEPLSEFRPGLSRDERRRL